MGFGSRAFLAGGLGFAAAFIVACGGSNGLLSGDEASTLSTQLDAVSAGVSAGNCQAATSAADAFNDSVGRLPSSVSDRLVQNLGAGAVTVKRLAARDCSSSSSPSTTSSTSNTTSTQSTSTTTTTVTQTPTTNSSTQPPSTSSATNTSPPGTSTAPSGGAGLGGANGNGNGNGANGNGNTGNGNGGAGQ